MNVNNWWVIMLLLIAGCSAPQLRPEASSVRLVINKPDTAQCKLLGEITGYPGNWGTEADESHNALMEAASNDLRNKAYAIGGNIIYLQKVDDSASISWILSGTTSISLTGLVYQCK